MGGVPFLISTTEHKREQGLIFVNMRHYISTAGELCRNVEEINTALELQIGAVKAPTVEFSLYDSSPGHDDSWINSYRDL